MPRKPEVSLPLSMLKELQFKYVKMKKNDLPTNKTKYPIDYEPNLLWVPQSRYTLPSY